MSCEAPDLLCRLVATVLVEATVRSSSPPASAGGAPQRFLHVRFRCPVRAPPPLEPN